MESSTFAKTLYMWLTGIIIIALIFGFSILSIIVGNYERCDEEMADFLITSGAIGIVTSTLDLLHKATNPERENKPQIVYFLQLVQLAVCIWGMTQTWVFQKNPCSDLLYYTAFVAANIWWWIMAILFVICFPIMCIYIHDNDTNSM